MVKSLETVDFCLSRSYNRNCSYLARKTWQRRRKHIFWYL